MNEATAQSRKQQTRPHFMIYTRLHAVLQNEDCSVPYVAIVRQPFCKLEQICGYAVVLIIVEWYWHVNNVTADDSPLENSNSLVYHLLQIDIRLHICF